MLGDLVNRALPHALPLMTKENWTRGFLGRRAVVRMALGMVKDFVGDGVFDMYPEEMRTSKGAGK